MSGSYQFGCDGHGNANSCAQPTSASPTTALPFTRRSLLGSALGMLAWWAKDSTALASLAVAPPRDAGRPILVVVFLRGGADGLNLVAPYGDDDYYRNRPTIGVAAPKDRRKSTEDRAVDLNGFFGLHPALSPLHRYYKEGELAIIHACGSLDQSRSHFEAMTLMERGQGSEPGGISGGWLARHLASAPTKSQTPLRAVAFSNVMPESLRGATSATSLNSLEEFRLVAPGSNGEDSAVVRALNTFYEDGSDAVAQAGRETLDVLAALRRIDPANYKPAMGAVYPNSEMGRGLQQVACLVKARVGLEVACLDHRGPYLWDTHVAQNGIFAAQAGDLGQAMAAFARDLGKEMQRVTIIAMTEFGRRVAENSGLGTDHGRASVMFLMGGGIAGGKIYGEWPGLAAENLEDPGDIRVTTDYRDVLCEVLARRLGNRNLNAVFPGYKPHLINIIKA